MENTLIITNLNGCLKVKFAKESLFEDIWIEENVHHNHERKDLIKDNDYIDYKIWDDINSEKLFKKHCPNTLVISQKHPNIVFHGGCLGCVSQQNHGIYRCVECRYFKFNALDKKADLSIK